LRKFGNFPDFNLGTQKYNVGIYLLLQDTSSDFILFWKNFTTGQQKKRPLPQIQRLFLSKTNGPLSPHYEEKNLKAPYLYIRLYIACHQNNA
jgi:hypothetical protein